MWKSFQNKVCIECGAKVTGQRRKYCSLRCNWGYQDRLKYTDPVRYQKMLGHKRNRYRDDEQYREFNKRQSRDKRLGVQQVGSG